jgi:uncharacterized membrane protein
MSNYDTFEIYAAEYKSTKDAESDFNGIKDLYRDTDIMDTFDATVFAKGDDGKVKIVKKREEPTRQGAFKGAGWGLATGVVVSLFPGAALGAGLLAGSAGIGAAIGAMAGHAHGGMSRGDIKDLGEALDAGDAGLVVIAATDVADRVEDAFNMANNVVKKEIKADRKQLDKELKKIEKEARS